MLIWNQKIQIHRRRKVSSVYATDGDAGFTWEDPEVIDVPFKVSIQPGGTTEDDRDRPRTVSSFTMYTPVGRDLDIRSQDRVVLGDMLTMDVVGEPRRWPDPHKAGKIHHVEVSLEVTRG